MDDSYEESSRIGKDVWFVIFQHFAQKVMINWVDIRNPLLIP